MTVTRHVADARRLPVSTSGVDLVVTSPPYWRKRDYGFDEQIGQESTAVEYVEAIMTCLTDWRRVLVSTGSVFLNVGDTYHHRSLAGVPGMIEMAARADGWLLRNRIVWTKSSGMPDSARTRLTNRYEYVLHLTPGNHYYYDLFGYARAFGADTGANPGDVWDVPLERDTGEHLAPFPTDLARRCITLACPSRSCRVCGKPCTRIVERTNRLDERRPQARRALELAASAGLTVEHFAAIRATGIADVGKALQTQTGAGRNSEDVKRLAGEAKAALGGYFREFTMGIRESRGWRASCAHTSGTRPGVVLDPFAGTGTTLDVADEMGRDAIGIDLAPLGAFA